MKTRIIHIVETSDDYTLCGECVANINPLATGEGWLDSSDLVVLYECNSNPKRKMHRVFCEECVAKVDPLVFLHQIEL